MIACRRSRPCGTSTQKRPASPDPDAFFPCRTPISLRSRGGSRLRSGLAVATLTGGVQALVAGVLPVLEDFFSDQLGRLPGYDGSLQSQLAEANRELRHQQELLAGVEAAYAGLSRRVADRRAEEARLAEQARRTGRPVIDPNAGTNLLADRAGLLDARALEEQTAERRIAVAQARREIDTLEVQIAQQDRERQARLRRSLSGVVDAVKISTREAGAGIAAAVDQFAVTLAELAPSVEQTAESTSDAVVKVTAGPVEQAVGGIYARLSGQVRGLFDDLDAELQAGLASIENVPRRLEALGRQRDAQRARLVVRQIDEQQRFEGDPAQLAQLQALQELERQRFDLDTQRTATIERLTAAKEQLEAVERRATVQLETGNLTRAEARDLIDRQREAFSRQATAARAELEELERRFPQFAELIAQTRAEVENAVQLEPQVVRTGREGFVGGVRSELKALKREAEDLFAVGQRLIATTASSLTSGLVSAIEAGVRGTKNWGEAFRDWAVDVLISIGRVLAEAAILYAVAIGLEAIAPGLASVLGVSAQAGAAAGRNQGGEIIGRNRGGGTDRGAGGGVKRRASGAGVVFGGVAANRDSVLTALTRGEVVWSRPAVEEFGGASRVMHLHDMLLGRASRFSGGGGIQHRRRSGRCGRGAATVGPASGLVARAGHARGGGTRLQRSGLPDEDCPRSHADDHPSNCGGPDEPADHPGDRQRARVAQDAARPLHDASSAAPVPNVLLRGEQIELHPFTS